MPLTNYIDANLTAKRDKATAERQLRRAYDAALETTKVNPTDNYVAPDRLEIDAVRNTFKNTIVSSLCAPYAAALAHMPHDLQIAQQQILSGFFGFGRTEVDKIVDLYKENIDFNGFFANINQATQYKNALERRFDHPRSIMDGVNTADVVAHVGITPAHPGRITLEDKIELMKLHEENGVVPPNSIKDKPYM